MIEYIIENISWIKDIFTLAFTATATVIGILTYRRARYTILQPIRSEAIKKQSELFSNLLITLSNDISSVEDELDYTNIVVYNVLYSLKEYGFIFKNQEELFTRLEGEISGFLYVGESKQMKDAELILPFQENKMEEKSIDNKKERYNRLKEGIVEIDNIYLTVKHSNYIKKLGVFVNDPFMQKEIRNVLISLLQSININVSKIMKEELGKFILEFSKKYFASGKAPYFNPIGVFNEFNHRRLQHYGLISELCNEMRSYLLIDKKW